MIDHTNLDVEDLELRPDFGLDPHVLPQFELLVAEGKITREFADKVIAERQAAGLPMTPQDLQPRPAPIVKGLAWVAEFGGPEIRSYRERDQVEIGGFEWSWYVYGTVEHTNLTCHLRDASGAHSGWISLARDYAGAAVHWERTKIVDTRPSEDPSRQEIKTVKASGVENSFAAALESANEWQFLELEFGGYTWYQVGEDKWLVPSWKHADEMEVSRGSHEYERDGRKLRWHWTARPEALATFLAVLKVHELHDLAATQEEAMAAATGVHDAVIGAAKQLVGDIDAFAAGKAAGRAELMLQISRLV